MGKYVIESKFENTRCFLEVACENREPYFFINRVDSLTPYTVPDLEQVRKEGYDKGYDDCRYRLNLGKVKNDAFDDGYECGLADAWEAARKIMFNPDDGGISAVNVHEIFGESSWTVMKDFSVSEVIAKIKAWEEKKQEQEIKVGDEVKNTQTGAKFIVTHLWKNNRGEQGVSGFNQECSAFSTTLSLVVKTGRHFPEIDNLLEKMREES